MDGADFLLPANMLPVLAIKLQLVGLRSASHLALTYFSPELLASVTYEFHRQGEWWQSNLGEQIWLDQQGWISELRIAEKDILIRRVERKLPRWPTPSHRANRQEQSVEIGRAKRQQSSTGVQTVTISIPTPIGKVGASLALPPRRKPLIAKALFLGGSGRHDRNGVAAGIDLGYRTLLEALVRSGIASLRHDKPGTGTTRLGTTLQQPSFDYLVQIAESALNLLKTRARLLRVPLVLIGHSQGGLIGLDIAARHNEIDGLVLLATAGRPIDQVIEWQIATQFAIRGLSHKVIETQLKELRELYWHVRHTPEWTPEVVPARIYARRSELSWHRSILSRDPLKLIAQVRCPVLILQGDKDVQVSQEDAEMLYNAARSAEVPVEMRILPNHNHLLRRVLGESLQEGYFDRRRRISSVAIQAISEWFLCLCSQLVSC
jgi:alpha-beta hydrolase superfamily lysophospholipase